MQLTYSIADQNFATATSMGIYNLSIGYVRALVEHAGVEGVTILSNPTITELSGLNHKADIKAFDYPVRNVAGRLWWDQAGCYREARKAGHPWLFLPKGFGSVIQRCPVKLAVCISDTTSVIYRDRYPQAVSAAKHAYYVWSHRQTIQHADLIFTISDFSRMEIEAWAKRQGLSCPPVVVAGCAADPDWPVLPRQDQILIDVRRAPHKRTDLAIQYVEQWRHASGYTGRVIAVGTMPDDVSLPDDPAWEFAGRIATDQRKNLIASSRVLVHFTEQEGFGLPPVEATIAGTPSVYSLIPVTREVMGDTGFPFVNEDYESFAAAMDEALVADPARVSDWGRNLEERHNWTRCGEHIVEALKQHA
jgi:glycosyltransferase involved in cell wall biosynthesis